MSNVPYEKTFELTAIGGQDNFFELAYPYRGSINRFVASQVTGDLSGFSLDLYNSERALPSIASSSSSSEGNPPPDRENFKILPTQSAGAGEKRSEMFDKWIGYCSQDGSPTNRPRKLYLRITPGGAGNKVFQVTIVIHASPFS